MVTVKSLLTLATQNSWPLIQLDVNNAFLNGDLDEEVYMQLPQGYTPSAIHSANNTLVCKLHKSSYGLRQASRQWYSKFSSFLISQGFIQSKADYSLFYKGVGKNYVALLVYVDDIVLTGASISEINAIKESLSNTFKLKDLGKLQHFLGLEIARSAQGIFLSQRQYALKLLEDTDKLAAKPVQYPMEPACKTSNFEGLPLQDPASYRRLIGRLMYLTITRPDITYVAATHLLKYLKLNPGQGLFLSSNSSLKIRAFSVSDWAGCSDTRRSMTGFCVFIGDSMVSWKTKKQTIVSRSSTEAEYRALAVTTTEIVWLHHLLTNFRVYQHDPTAIFCDNESAIQLALNPTFDERTKHIEIDCHFIRDKILDKTVKLLPIRTTHQLADIFTKPLPRHKMIPIMSKMALHNIFQSSS
ncbi:uncharacterized mitochondrial protein AtMg00810-like [Lactuca sativa]|uniref:Reverse transcriptase Ty1/copia-type domain-containing protein n=1 Tax=Lactuca sativa TaxID=4236 RepID=A0A9R1XCK6_LACSA|nr:uncharacterized mitochondrial protein AtMg00810-like [Lactuca sativa]KAJ0207786.1 hypothetical protein LSAT_V11C500230020 [Lactuca sativa]